MPIPYHPLGGAIAEALRRGKGSGGRYSDGTFSFTREGGMCAKTISEIFESLGYERPQCHAYQYPTYLEKHGAERIPASKAQNMNAWDLAGNIIVYDGDHDWGNEDYGHVGVLVAVPDGDSYTLKVRSNMSNSDGVGEVRDLPARLWTGNNRNLAQEGPAWKIYNPDTMYGLGRSTLSEPETEDYINPHRGAMRSMMSGEQPAPQRPSADGYINNQNRGAISIMSESGDKFADLPNGTPVQVLEQRDGGVMKVQALGPSGEPSGSPGWISTEAFKLR